jgi:23S rRNA (adenine2030-N6)-methyltransferase
MLSYRHAFHAGSHADVLKHSMLLLMLDYMQQKDKPFWYIDTHAGAGRYRLQALESQKTREYELGIGRLWARDDLPPALQLLRDGVRRENSTDTLQAYPGSPLFAANKLRADDRLRLFELHPQDHDVLKMVFEHDKRALIAKQDGLSGLKSLLPPLPRRALVLIDPSYEEENEYRLVVEALKESLRRFPTGTYAVWYPLLEQAEAKRLPPKLEALRCASTLRAELRVRSPESRPELKNGGMYGSGMFVINPPWTLAAQLREMLPYLANVLKEDAGADWRLDIVDK